jgi:DNA-binding LacI/PurR family transcriptional regulator
VKSKQRPTIYTIADMADVSISTVSRIINRTFAGEQDVLDRVQEAIRKVDYVPRPEARRLVGKRIESRIIGVLAPFFIHPFFVEVLKGVYKTLHEHEYSIMLHDVTTKEQKKAMFRKVREEGLADGLLLVNMHLDREEYLALRDKMQVVLVAAQADFADYVMVDQATGIAKGVQYVHSLGHRHVAFINNEKEIYETTSRESAFRETADRLGIRYLVDYRAVDRRAGYLAAKTILTNNPGITCLFYYSDLMAYGGVDYVNEHRLGVKISIIGFDGFEMSRHMDLTTIAQPMEAMGSLGAQVLLRKLREHDGRTERIVLETTLVKGKTCKAVIHE